jgi:hypothetical protein
MTTRPIDVLDMCSDVAHYERHADRIAETLTDGYTNGCHSAARLLCGPENHGARLWVSDAMGQLCAAAATTLPEKLAVGGISLHADDLPWPSGTVVFETPLFDVPEKFVDTGSEEGPIDVMQWVTHTTSNGDTGAVVVFWQSRSRSEDPTSGLPPLWPRAVRQIPFRDSVPVDGDPNFYALLSLWTMLSQRIALTETRTPSRPSVKRWQRKHGHEPEPIVIVTLRLPDGHNGTKDAPGGGVDWTHQWIVDGHWRNQPYGPGHSLRRLQWIAPFVKGPEDMPLVVKEKIHAWTR